MSYSVLICQPPSDAVLKQLKSTSNLAVGNSPPPVALGETPRAMPAEIHLATFLAALMETLEYGMEGAPPVCKQRVVTLRSELEQVKTLVEVNLRRYFNPMAEHSVNLRQLFLSHMIICLHEGMKALAVQGAELYRRHIYAAPTPGTGNSMAIPTFK